MEIKKNIPKLRFKEFSDDWKKNKLKDISTIITGTTPSTVVEEYYNGNNHFVSPADIQNNRYIEKTKTTLTELGLSKTRKINKGSVVFVCIGSTIGKIAQATKICATNQQINTLEAKDDYSNNFIYSLLELKGKKIKLLAGVQAVPQINKTDFSNIQFFFPQLKEQQKIADFLTVVDTKINQLQKKKSLLQDYEKGIMQQIFSQKLQFKDKDGKAFPNWEEKMLGEVLSIGSGKDYKHLDKGNIPVYGTGGIMTFVDDYLFNGNSVGIGRKGTIDKPVYLEGKFWTVDTLFYTHSFIDVLPKYIYFLFLRINWRKYNEASGVPSLSKATIEKIDISIPCLEEQIQIANFLSAIDTKIDLVNTQLENTQIFKKGLLQQMFV